MSNIKRRDFITLIGGAAGWPLVARAQQPRVPVIGFLSFRSSGESASAVAAFRKGLGEAGYTEGQNLAIEFRWADGQYGRLQALAADLVRRQVAVIAATGGPASGQTAKAAIPIVFVSGADPVQEGLVASLNRPGGNATGVNPLLPAMEGKRLGFLREVVPNAALVGVLANPVAPFVDRRARARRSIRRGACREVDSIASCCCSHLTDQSLRLLAVRCRRATQHTPDSAAAPSSNNSSHDRGNRRSHRRHRHADR